MSPVRVLTVTMALLARVIVEVMAIVGMNIQSRG